MTIKTRESFRFKVGDLCKFTSNGIGLYESPHFSHDSLISNIKNKTALLVKITLTKSDNSVLGQFLFNGRYVYANIHDGSHFIVVDPDRELIRIKQNEREKEIKEKKEKEEKCHQESVASTSDSENWWWLP